MPNYKDMYFKLAAKVADAVDLLIDAQTQGEDSYISDESRPAIKKVDVVSKNKRKTPLD